MINRINLILRAKNITARQFAEEIGIQPSGMSHIMSGRNNPSLEFVSKVIRRYPEIDANWLLMGRGEMYATDAPATDTPSAPAAEPMPPVPAEPPKAEPTLFPTEEEETEVVHKVSEPVYRPSYVAVPPQESSSDIPADEGRTLVRMLLIYSDNTFVEYRPQREEL